jgi:hypothetical protein
MFGYSPSRIAAPREVGRFKPGHKQPSARPAIVARMIPRAEECRRKAKEADALAETARDQAARDMLREVADLWRKLAAQVEKRGW